MDQRVLEAVVLVAVLFACVALLVNNHQWKTNALYWQGCYFKLSERHGEFRDRLSALEKELEATPIPGDS